MNKVNKTHKSQEHSETYKNHKVCPQVINLLIMLARQDYDQNCPEVIGLAQGCSLCELLLTRVASGALEASMLQK